MRRPIIGIAIAVFILAEISLMSFYLFSMSGAPAVTTQVNSNCIDIPALPDYLTTGKPEDAVAALNNARSKEHLTPLNLPKNFYHLTPVQMQFLILNQERTSRGLSPLHFDDELARVATFYSRQLRDLHFFAHSSPISGTFAERVNANPVFAKHYALAAENLAGNPIPGIGSMYEYLYNDASENCGHRQNILDPSLTLVGIGYATGSQYGSISAQEFLSSSPLNPYVATVFQQNAAPHISLQNLSNGQIASRTSSNPASGSTILLVVHITDQVGGVRITWFLDHVGNQAHTGDILSLDLSKLAAGDHLLLIYAVNGEQNYGTISYTIVACSINPSLPNTINCR